MPHKDPEAARAWRKEWWAKSPEMRDKQNARAREMRKRINEMSDLVQRLRADIETWEGHYSEEMFVRYFPPPPLQLEAAKQIEDDEALMRQALMALEKVVVAFGPGLTLQQNVITALRERLEGEK